MSLDKTKKIISAAREDDRTILTEVESKQIISEGNISVVETLLATTKKEAVEISGKIGYPVALKIVASEITHKSDSGGVKLNLQNASSVKQAYSEIMANIESNGFSGKVLGVSVQKMIPDGIEIIMGMSKDAQFGPVLMFGLGGVFVEVMNDVSFRIIPIAQRDASQMVREIKSYPVLEGYRGQLPTDITAIEETLCKLSDFVQSVPEIKELDLNPVFARADGAIVADARIMLEPLDN